MHSFLAFAFHNFYLSVPFNFKFLVLLTCAPNRSGSCISFYLFLTSNIFMSSASFFSLPLFPLFYGIFQIAFLFSPSSHVPSSPSPHILIFPCTGGRYAFFSAFAFFSGVSFLVLCCSFLKPFLCSLFHECGQLCCVFVW